MRIPCPPNCRRIFRLVVAPAIFLLTGPPGDCQGSGKNQVVDNTTVQADAIARPQPTTFLAGYSSKDTFKWTDVKSGLEFDTLPTDGTMPSCLSDSPKADRAYVFHVVHWGKDHSVLSSSWSAYSAHKLVNNDAKLVRELTATGDPLIYGKKTVLFIGVNYADSVQTLASLNITYKLSVTQGTPKNVQDLSQLLTALLGATTGTAAGKAVKPPARVAFACISGTNHLPFSINVVETASLTPSPAPDQPDKPAGDSQLHPSAAISQPSLATVTTKLVRNNARILDISFPQENNSPQKAVDATGTVSPSQESSGEAAPTHGAQTPKTDQNASSGAKKSADSTPTAGLIDCTTLSQSAKGKNGAGTQSPSCTISRTFESLDREWWDVSLAVSIPGVRETKYSLSGSALSAKPTTHTDVYAFIDLIPSSYLGPTSPIPHFIVGVPTKSQPLYRPVFGLSEDFTGWTGLQKRGFPLAMSFFAGAVWMKTTTVSGSPTTSAQLTADSSTERVWKAIFGVELPVASLISKIGKGSTKSSSKNTSSSVANQGSSATSAQ